MAPPTEEKMKLSEALRIAQKIKPWVDRMPEFRAAIEALEVLGKQQPDDPDLTPGSRGGEPAPSEPSLIERIRAEVGKAWTDFSEGLIDLPRTEDDTAKSEADRDHLDLLVEKRAGVLRVLQRTSFAEGWEQARLHYGTQTPDFPEGGREFHGAECDKRINADTYLCTCDDAAANAAAHEAGSRQYPDPQPSAPPKPGDVVRDHDAAIKLPYGTLIKGPSGVRGLVTSMTVDGKGSKHVDWASDRLLAHGDRWPAVIVDVNPLDVNLS